MAFAKIQSKPVTGAGPSFNASYASTPSVNNLLVIAVSSSGPNSPATSITDNQSGNTYTQVGTAATSAGGDSIQIFFCIVAGASGTFTITVNFGGAAVGATAAIFEYSGGATSSIQDQTNIGTGSSNTPASTSITPSANNYLVFAACVDANGDGTSITAGTGFTIQETQLTSSTHERIGTEHEIQTTATARTGAFSLGGSANWAAKVVSFKVLATGGFGTVVQGYKNLLGVGQ